jgi:RNA polymerase sigma-70 factor (ECF subfamily)|tara:strand:- start:3197 stop:3784 length:588 start_codon:yes stop_codon:yes gene_type:complete
MNDDIKPDSVDPGISAGMGLEEPDSTSTEWVRAAIELHEGALLRYAQHFVRDLESARDIVQDTFLQLCRQTNDEIRPRVAQWLFTVCRNRAIDVCRKERRMKLAPEDQLADKLAQNSEASELQPSAAMERQEAATGLMSQISKLPDRQQEVLRLKFNAGLSYKEIAEVTGLTSSNVGFILHTAIAKLRQSLVPAS